MNTMYEYVLYMKGNYMYSVECDVKDGSNWSVIGDANLSAIV